MRKGTPFWRSFKFAAEGIKHTFRHERNFKIHSILSVFVLIAGWLVHLTKERWMILFIVIGIILSLELINTAIERTIDLVTAERHPLAKQAKDASAGAVLVFSAIAVIIGVLLFVEPFAKGIERIFGR